MRLRCSYPGCWAVAANGRSTCGRHTAGPVYGQRGTMIVEDPPTDADLDDAFAAFAQDMLRNARHRVMWMPAGADIATESTPIHDQLQAEFAHRKAQAGKPRRDSKGRFAA